MLEVKVNDVEAQRRECLAVRERKQVRSQRKLALREEKLTANFETACLQVTGSATMAVLNSSSLGYALTATSAQGPVHLPEPFGEMNVLQSVGACQAGGQVRRYCGGNMRIGVWGPARREDR